MRRPCGPRCGRAAWRERVVCRRECRDAPDSDFIGVDWLDAPARSAAPPLPAIRLSALALILALQTNHARCACQPIMVRMDDIVRQAMAKWPNVPHAYGWLGLDARGNWWLRDAEAQALGAFGSGVPGARGALVRLDKLIEFIQRNSRKGAQD